MKESIRKLKEMNVPQKTKLKSDLTYVEDQEISSAKEFSGLKRPKWQSPSTEFQKDFLVAVGRKYYSNKNERSAVIAIEKSRLYLASGLVSVYPAEWIESCISWAIKKRHDGYMVAFNGLVNLINDKDRREQFITNWQRKHPEVVLKRQITDMEEPEDGRSSVL